MNPLLDQLPKHMRETLMKMGGYPHFIPAKFLGVVLAEIRRLEDQICEYCDGWFCCDCGRAFASQEDPYNLLADDEFICWDCERKRNGKTV